MIKGLITAFILSIFGFDKMVVEVINSFGIKASESHYYVLFALIGYTYRLVDKSLGGNKWNYQMKHYNI